MSKFVRVLLTRDQIEKAYNEIQGNHILEYTLVAKEFPCEHPIELVTSENWIGHHCRACDSKVIPTKFEAL